MAITQPAIEITGPVQMATAVTRLPPRLRVPAPAFLINPQVSLVQGVTVYRRIKPTFGQAIEVRPSVLLAAGLTKLPRRLKIFPSAILIDLITRPRLAGDNTIELVYRIPDRLRIRPHLIAPPNGSQDRLGQPIMRWTDTGEAAYYEVHVALDIDFTQRIARFNVLGTELQRGFPFGGTYYWRVRAVAGVAYSEYSEVWSFSVPSLLPGKVIDHDPQGRFRLLTQFRENE